MKQPENFKMRPALIREQLELLKSYVESICTVERDEKIIFDYASETHIQRERKALKDIHDILNDHKLIGPNENIDMIQIGSKVDLFIDYGFSDTENQSVYLIVDRYINEDPEVFVTQSSPLGKALLGKETGAKVNFLTPNGEVQATVLKVNNGNTQLIGQDCECENKTR